MKFSNLSNATRIKLKINTRDWGVIKTTALIQPLTLIFVLPYLIPAEPVLQKTLFRKQLTLNKSNIKYSITPKYNVGAETDENETRQG